VKKATGGVSDCEIWFSFYTGIMPQSDERFTAQEIKALREENPVREKTPERVLTPQERLDAVRRDLGYFVKNYRQFQANYPEIDHELDARFPQFRQATADLMNMLDVLSAPDGGISDAAALQYLSRYNAAAPRINAAFDSLRQDQRVAGDPLHAALNAGETLSLNDTQKAETIAFARQLFKQIFPESNVSQTVRLATGQSHLEDYQKVLVAPAEGIEAVVMGFINLFNPQTYRDLNDGIQTACGMDYEEWCTAWKMLKSVYENASGADIAEVSISFIVAVCFLLGGVSKLGQIAKGMKVPAYLMPAVETVTVGSRALHYSEKLQILPLGVLGGLSLKYGQ
jgi:hypothetical protein